MSHRIDISYLPFSLVVAVLAGASPAAAQSYVMTTQAEPYTSCQETTRSLSGNDDFGTFDISLPFPFRFYDDDVTALTVGTNGAVVMAPGASIPDDNPLLGSATSPNALIAPFYTDLRFYSINGGYVGYSIEGRAPERSVCIEWNQVSIWGSSSMVFDMKVILREGAIGQIELHYGETVRTRGTLATMGIEDENGTREVLTGPGGCTSCTFADLVAMENQKVVLFQDRGPELKPIQIDAPDLAFIGAETPVDVEIVSSHGRMTGPFEVQVRASPSPDMAGAVVIGSAQTSVGPYETQTVRVNVRPTGAFGPTRVYFDAVVDAADEIAEVDETNNTVVAVEHTSLIEGQPDLSVERVTTDIKQVDAGGSVTVYSTIRNVGSVSVRDVTTAVVLSTNPTISRQDIRLTTYSVSLAPGETVTTTVAVTINDQTNSGSYWLGTLVDPDQVLEELRESNNGRASLDPVSVVSGTLSVMTSALPTAMIRDSYTGAFQASGGEPPYVWSLVEGRLPAGLDFVPETGLLFGRATTVETQNFTVQVVDAGGLVASRALTLRVIDPLEPLTIVTRSLPAARVGQEYAAQLLSTKPDALWSADLPAGLILTETGVLMGTLTAVETLNFTVTAQFEGESATRDLELEVVESTGLQIVSEPLSTARWGEAYGAQLTANGGIPPITWAQLRGLPAGLSLAPDGRLSGTPEQVGTFQLVVEARDAAAGSLAARDVNTFQLTVLDAEGFIIVTEQLADATVGGSYDESISALGGLPPYEWQIVGGQLPDGLVSNVDLSSNELRIIGSATAVGDANLLIEAVDVQGRRTQRAFLLRVTSPTVAPELAESSCTCVTPAARVGGWGVWLGFIGLLLVRRRRSAPKAD